MKKMLNRIRDRIIEALGGFTRQTVGVIREQMIRGAMKDSRVIIAGFEGKPVKMMPDVRRLNVRLTFTDDIDLDGEFKDIAREAISKLMAEEIAKNSYFEKQKTKEYDGESCEYHFMVYVLNPPQETDEKQGE